jgi:hypothetical protein
MDFRNSDRTAASSMVRRGPPLFGAGVATAEHPCDLLKLCAQAFAFDAAPGCCGVRATKSGSLQAFRTNQISIGISQPLNQLTSRYKGEMSRV